MRKRIIHDGARDAVSNADQHWLELGSLARVEIASEDAAHPIESTLLPETGPGWQTAGPREQTIRTLFDEPQRLSRTRLVFTFVKDPGGIRRQSPGQR